MLYKNKSTIILKVSIHLYFLNSKQKHCQNLRSRIIQDFIDSGVKISMAHSLQKQISITVWALKWGIFMTQPEKKKKSK